MAAPCALFASCSDFKPEIFIKNILKVTDLPESTQLSKDIFSYNWEIETKYYTATINLCTTNTRTIGDQAFADSVQAFILHFDNNKESGLKAVESWLPYLEQFEAQVQMLVCNTASESHVLNRLEIQKWCIDHQFEMVELEPEETSDSEDDFAETTGIKRIIQALHAHTWPNLCMKDNPDVRSPYIKQLMQEEAQSKASNNSKETETDIPNGLQENSASQTKENTSLDTASGITNGKINNKKEKNAKLKKEKIDALLPKEEQEIINAISLDHPEQESFEELFGKLKVMKDKADSMPMEDRRAYAEKVALSFWTAIGGDEDEISGLTGSEDED